MSETYIPADLERMIVDARQRMHGLGLDPGPLVPSTMDDLKQLFTLVPAFYTLTIELGGNTGDIGADTVGLRPEPFLMTRITYACSGDTPVFNGGLSVSSASAQGRSVEIEWSDEFTKFMGERPCMPAALFGDSNGFMDMTGLCLFQGKQALSAKISRFGWPFSGQVATTRWDINFAGFGILPKGVAQSGSAG